MPDVPALVADLDAALDAAPEAVSVRSEVPRELLQRSTLGELLRYAAIDWVILLLAWAAMALCPWWTWPVFILVVGGRLHAFGVILHDACHLPYRNKTLPWRLLEVLCGFPMATTVDGMRYHHLRHHRDNGFPSDPYFKSGLEGRPWLWWLNVARGLILLPFWTIRPYVGVVAWLVPGARNVYGRMWLQDRSGEDLTHSDEVIRCGREEIGQLLFQLGWIVALFFFPWHVTFGYLLPATIMGVLAARRLLREHNYHRVADRRLDTILATTNDHHLDTFDAIFLAPHGIGYHVVHHLHPQVGLAHVAALTAWYRQRLPNYRPPLPRWRTPDAAPR